MRYIVAVDDSKVTLRQITKSVSKKLGTGKFKVLSKEDALLNKEITVILVRFTFYYYQINSLKCNNI